MTTTDPTEMIAGLLREHLDRAPDVPDPGAGPFAYYERAEIARARWERERDAFHTLIAARLLRGFLRQHDLDERGER